MEGAGRARGTSTLASIAFGVMDTLEEAQPWVSFNASSSEAYLAFYLRVKPLLANIVTLAQSQSEIIAELNKKLRAAENAAAEYRSRAESQEKVNETMNRELREKIEEIAQLKNLNAQAAKSDQARAESQKEMSEAANQTARELTDEISRLKNINVRAITELQRA